MEYEIFKKHYFDNFFEYTYSICMKPTLIGNLRLIDILKKKNLEHWKYTIVFKFKQDENWKYYCNNVSYNQVLDLFDSDPLNSKRVCTYNIKAYKYNINKPVGYNILPRVAMNKIFKK